MNDTATVAEKHPQEEAARGPAGGPRPEGGGTVGDAASRLESSPNKRKSEDERPFFLCTRGCRCRTCPTCGPKYGRKVRNRLLAKAHHFKNPALLTLTVDRSHFASPLDAYLIISDGGYVRLLMRLLGVVRWVWVLEFQMKTGDGWPHWHLVIDLPPGRLDLKRAWRLWRDKWGLGGLDLQLDRDKGPEHALMYITKYLTKYPEEGFPSWILDLDRRVRFVGACRKLGPMVSDQEKTTADVAEDDPAAESLPTHPHRPLAVRMAECGELVDVLEADPEKPDGYCFVGRLPADSVNAALKSSGLTLEQDAGKPPHVTGTWADFATFAAEVAYRSSMDLTRFTRKRTERQRAILRDAAAVTRTPHPPPCRAGWVSQPAEAGLDSGILAGTITGNPRSVLNGETKTDTW